MFPSHDRVGASVGVSVARRVSRTEFLRLMSRAYRPNQSFYERHMAVTQGLNGGLELVKEVLLPFAFGGTEEEMVYRFERSEYGRGFAKNYALAFESHRTPVDAVSLEPGYASVDFKIEKRSGFTVSKTQMETCFIFLFFKSGSLSGLRVMKHPLMKGVLNFSI